MISTFGNFLVYNITTDIKPTTTTYYHHISLHTLVYDTTTSVLLPHISGQNYNVSLLSTYLGNSHTSYDTLGGFHILRQHIFGGF